MKESEKKNFVNAQLWRISDHLYEELKLIECGQHSLNALPYQIIQGENKH